MFRSAVNTTKIGDMNNYWHQTINLCSVQQ